MTFENQYLTYTEYTSLGGEQIGETPFNLLEYEARKQIDLRTQNRLKNLDTIPDEVKMCMFNLINKIESYNTASQDASGNVANESIDGYSITYITSTQIREIIASKNVEIEDIIVNDLYGVIVNNEHLIFAGIE
jgi:hypothetical protein